jgi:hypothetical protein
MADKKVAEKATKTASSAAKKEDGEAAVLTKITVMPAPYHAIGERPRRTTRPRPGSPPSCARSPTEVAGYAMRSENIGARVGTVQR